MILLYPIHYHYLHNRSTFVTPFLFTQASGQTHLLMQELNKCIPNSEVRQRKAVDLKKLIPEAIKREFTDILAVNEDRKIPNGLLLIHLPDGPTAHFKLTSFRRGYDIRVGCPSHLNSRLPYLITPAKSG